MGAPFSFEFWGTAWDSHHPEVMVFLSFPDYDSPLECERSWDVICRRTVNTSDSLWWQFGGAWVNSSVVLGVNW